MADRKAVFSRPNHQDVKITGGFWGEKLQQIHTVTVWDVLDKFEHDHEEGIMKNFEWVSQGQRGQHIGPPWYDGLICEVIRGISDIIALSYDQKLDEKIEYYTSMIEKAQDVDPDGFLDTYTTLMCPDQRFGQNGGSLIWQHNLYNMGCLTEAGIHYYRATKKTRLLKCAVKAANYLCRTIGPEPRKNIVPAHSLPEEAMVKLCCLFREDEKLADRMYEEYGIKAAADDYLALAKFWMDHRGVHHNRASMPKYMGEYSQDHCPVTEQSEAVGHAVRAALMYTGLTAVGIETGEDKYLDAAKRIWDNVELTKLHISGGIGAVHNEERFGYQYDLPNDAYLETCAGVALAFWAGEMHRAFGDRKYIDVLECALYNNVLPSLAADGTHYFYENPLISDGSIERWNWHACPCCPPMFLKLMGSLPDYIYSVGKGGVYINLPISSCYTASLEGGELTISQEESLPWEGIWKITVSAEKALTAALGIRIPPWAGKVLVNGKSLDPNQLEQGYFVLTQTWSGKTEISIEMELPAIKVEAHPYVDADIGRVALWRGPLLYCLEEIDNPLETDVVLGDDPLAVEDAQVVTQAKVISGKTLSGERFCAVPYYLWNNRGKGKMNVWVRQAENGVVIANQSGETQVYAAHAAAANQKKLRLDGWENKLYRAYRGSK